MISLQRRSCAAVESSRRDNVERSYMRIVFRGLAVVFICFLLTSCFSIFGKKTVSSADTGPKPPKKETVAKPAPEEDKAKTKDNTEKQTAEKPKPEPPKEGAKKESGKDKEEDQAPPIQKHDHAKLVAKIRQKAEEQVKEVKDCVLARLCEDVMMQRWDLYVYYKDGKQYWWDTFSWNDFEGKWTKEEFVMDRRPLKDWQSHLTYQDSKKKCTKLR
jgi:hypothetical protein